MADIQISDLTPAGLELFQDSESFLHELTDREMMVTGGGDKYYTIITNYNTGIEGANTVGNTINANTQGNNNSVFKFKKDKKNK